MEKKNKKIKIKKNVSQTTKHTQNTQMPLHTYQDCYNPPPLKKLKNSMVSQGCRETRTLYIADGEVNWYHHYNKYFWSLQKIKVRETT